ncbi:hypothetical protein D5R81_08995 [Parashewanella spongiae]|uniref:Uncharacterized protein n=1 Tax=Parashewanella spongiae TaxID=342950 RepID=A0A3A6TX61_9GAMM|nr:hypothetical protein [Parashewanella spongiae]MCL1077976.1 hypothetical protein [Parashewanella spongiae]RJY16413.1 hypothetical protein D5R81_08995 [Parashewanella spongiae]
MHKQNRCHSISAWAKGFLIISATISGAQFVSAGEAVYSEIQLPEGYFTIQPECENPNTQRLQVIVRQNQTNIDEVLLNVTTTPRDISSCHKDSGSPDANMALVFDELSGTIVAKLHSPAVTGHRTSSVVYSASPRLKYAVGSAVYTQGDRLQSAAVLWQRTSASQIIDEQYISILLPLPEDVNPNDAPTPQFVTSDGLTVFGTIYGSDISGETSSYPSYQVAWTRGSINDNFVFHFMPQPEKDYPNSFFELTSVSITGRELLLKEWNMPDYVNQKPKNEDTDYLPRFYLMRYDAQTNSMIEVQKTTKETYSLDETGVYAVQISQDAEKGLVMTSTRHINDQSESILLSHNRLPGNEDENSMGMTPELPSLTSFPQLTYDTKVQGEKNLGRVPNDSSVWIRDSAISSEGSFKSALTLFNQDCEIAQTKGWRNDEWLFLYQGIRLYGIDGGVRLLGYHIGLDKSTLFTVTLPEIGCVNTNYSN